MNRPLLSFRRTDFSISEDIEEVAKEFANHFTTRKNQIRFFCNLIKTSKYWNTNNLHEKLIAWKESVKRIKGTSKTVKLVEKAFNLCLCDDDINSLRGAMVESLIISHYGGAKVLSNPNKAGWGAKVYYHQNNQSQVIRYNCEKLLYDHCEDKATVDFGYWDGHHGKFYECKVLPKRIECKDKRFMENLSSVLTHQGISHEVFFVCADTEEAIDANIADIDIGIRLKSVGIRQLERGLES